MEIEPSQKAGLPEMKMENWPKYPQKLAKIGHFKTLKWPPIGQKNTAFLPIIYHILNISMHLKNENDNLWCLL